MENPPTSSTENAADKLEATLKPKRSELPSVAVALILLIGVVLVLGVYYKEQKNAANVARKNSSLSTQVATLTNEFKQQNNLNKGIVSVGSIYKDPTGKIGLLNGTITMNLPTGWVRLPQSNCTGGSIDSSVTCEDVAAVTPSSFVNSDGTTKWNVTIGVFDYSNAAGSAKSWYENKYFGDPISSFGVPQAVGVSTAPINGYSSLSFQWVAPPINNPDYTNDVYTVVHGQYAAVVSAQVQTGSVYGANAFDYRTTYQPLINQMVHSIKFQD